jgi:hypothetical protein
VHSYRVLVTVGRVLPGTRPEQVLPAVADAVAELATLEASSVSLARGVPQAVVRFSADDDEIAVQIAEHAAATVARLAEVRGSRLARRVGGAWRTVPGS